MTGVFLSYSRADKPHAALLIRGLRGLGVDVWWDEDMPGVDWQEELARQINELSAVVVLWTPHSVESKNVRDEARLGQQQDKLVNAMIGVEMPPFPFERTNGLPLDGWDGREKHNGWGRLVRTIDDLLAEKGAAKPGELVQTLARRERAIAGGQARLSQAEEAYRNAKADEAAVANAWDAAGAASATAQEQVRWVVDKNGSPAVMRAAQADLDAALEAQAAADAARKTCAAALTTASRAMVQAKRDLDRLFEETTGSGTLLRFGEEAPWSPPEWAPEPETPAPRVSEVVAPDTPPPAPVVEPAAIVDPPPAPPFAPADPAPAAAVEPPAPEPASFTTEFNHRARLLGAWGGALLFVLAVLLFLAALGAPNDAGRGYAVVSVLMLGAAIWSFTRLLGFRLRNNRDGTVQKKNPVEPWPIRIILALCLLLAGIFLFSH